jgi:hypothetical protein
MVTAPATDPTRRIAQTIALVALVLAPLRILAQGYLPGDDALRHAAKAVSGRPWSDVLLLRPGITLDSNPGWHALLGALHRGLGLGAVDLVLVSVVVLFVLFSLGPVLVLRRPAAWLLALALLLVLEPALVERLVSGRPFLLTSAIVPLVGLLWPRLEASRPLGALAFFAACGVAATWIHGSYYLLGLPVLALLLAGRTTAARRLALAFGVGILVGSALTGHPVGHLWQMLLHGYLSVGLPKPAAALVTEFQPFDGRPLAVIGFLALLAWRRARRPDAEPAWQDPVVVMAAGCWALGFVAYRFWIDWSAPALATLGALELQGAFEREPAQQRSIPRWAIAGGAAILVLLVTGSDLQRRWSEQVGRPFLVRENPTHAPWLPEPGGIAYSPEMGVFYALFFKNPDAPWKYTLGFEPAIMLPEDYRVFCEIKRSRGATEAYLPWVAKMGSADRLYVQQRSNVAPPIPGLEWFQPVYGIWAGRRPRAAGAEP